MCSDGAPLPYVIPISPYVSPLPRGAPSPGRDTTPGRPAAHRHRALRPFVRHRLAPSVRLSVAPQAIRCQAIRCPQP